MHGLDEHRGPALRRIELRVDSPGYGLPTAAVFEYTEWYALVRDGWALARYAYEYRPRPAPSRRAYHFHDPLGPHQHCVDPRRPAADHHFEAYRVVLEQAHDEFVALAASAAPISCGALRPLRLRNLDLSRAG